MKLFTAIAFLFLCLGSTVHAQTTFEFGRYGVVVEEQQCTMMLNPDFDSLTTGEINKAKQEMQRSSFFFQPQIFWVFSLSSNEAQVLFATTKLKVKRGAAYQVTFNFDNKVAKKIKGSNDSRSEYMLTFRFNPFNKMMLPYFKKHNKVKVKIKGNQAFEISLKGFSKANEKFEECIIDGGGALKEADPFD